jgi:nucleoside-diphosphate-sugar epimerase
MFTVLGASGYIGSHLVTELNKRKLEVWAPSKKSAKIFERDLGTIFYCIGLTADFRNKRHETIDAHVSYLSKILKIAKFDQIIYLSSTRLYLDQPNGYENGSFNLNPIHTDEIYNISKLLGENLVLGSDQENKVVRLSNVIGPSMGAENFIGSILNEAVNTGSVLFRTPPSFAKDYIWIDDVIEALIMVSSEKKDIYNIASGTNFTNKQFALWLNKNGINVKFKTNVTSQKFPKINIEKLTKVLKRSPMSGMEKFFQWAEKNETNFYEIINKE